METQTPTLTSSKDDVESQNDRAIETTRLNVSDSRGTYDKKESIDGGITSGGKAKRAVKNQVFKSKNNSPDSAKATKPTKAKGFKSLKRVGNVPTPTPDQHESSVENFDEMNQTQLREHLESS